MCVKVANLVNFGLLTRDMFRSINVWATTFFKKCFFLFSGKIFGTNVTCLTLITSLCSSTFPQSVLEKIFKRKNLTKIKIFSFCINLLSSFKWPGKNDIFLGPKGQSERSKFCCCSCFSDFRRLIKFKKPPETQKKISRRKNCTIKLLKKTHKIWSLL